eukprot:2840099-Alexandrium_andersonii.AAC.1
MLTATAYRLWAKTRLHDLRKWVAEWMPPQAFAGGKNRSAQDAWFQVAAKCEAATVQQKAIV